MCFHVFLQFYIAIQHLGRVGFLVHFPTSVCAGDVPGICFPLSASRAPLGCAPTRRPLPSACMFPLLLIICCLALLICCSTINTLSLNNLNSHGSFSTTCLNSSRLLKLSGRLNWQEENSTSDSMIERLIYILLNRNGNSDLKVFSETTQWDKLNIWLALCKILKCAFSQTTFTLIVACSVVFIIQKYVWFKKERGFNHGWFYFIYFSISFMFCSPSSKGGIWKCLLKTKLTVNNN